MAKINGLTQKEELFCQLITSGEKQAIAYEKAGYKFTTPKARNEAASRLAKKPRIIKRLKELREAVGKKFDYTREQAFKELETAQKIAMGAPVPMPDGTTKELPSPNPTAVIKAIEKKIDLAGIEPPKKLDVTGGVRITLPGETTRAEWEAGDE